MQVDNWVNNINCSVAGTIQHIATGHAARCISASGRNIVPGIACSNSSTPLLHCRFISSLTGRVPSNGLYRMKAGYILSLPPTTELTILLQCQILKQFNSRLKLKTKYMRHSSKQTQPGQSSNMCPHACSLY